MPDSQSAASPWPHAEGKLHPPSDEGKAPAAAGQNSQGRSETGDGSTAAHTRRYVAIFPFERYEVDAATAEEAARWAMQTFPHEVTLGTEVVILRTDCETRFKLDLTGGPDVHE